MKRIFTTFLTLLISLTMIMSIMGSPILASGSQTCTFQVGTSQVLYCGLYYNDGYNKTWTSSNSSVATVISNNGSYGTISLKSIGSCTIYFAVKYSKYEVIDYDAYNHPLFGYREYADGFTYYINVTKSGISTPGSVTIAESLQLKPRESFILMSTIKSTDGKYLKNYNTLAWTSSNKSVATVNQMGIVTGWAKGTTVVTVSTPEGIKDTCTVTVKTPIGYTSVSTAAQLNDIRKNVSANYVLTKNIVFSDNDFAPGGAFYNADHAWNPIDGFTGILDGNGFCIQNLHSKQYDAGLFSNLKGTVKNLEIRDGIFNGPGFSGAFFSTGTGMLLTGCKSTANTITGGIAGGFGGNISNYGYFFMCNNASLVNGSQFCGGIVGYSGSMSNFLLCVNNASIYSDTSAKVGGIIGQGSTYTIVKYCSNSGNISGKANIGGLFGEAGAYSEIRQSFNIGKVTGNGQSSLVGGIGGRGYTTYVSDCYNAGSLELISGSSGLMGGIAGNATNLSYSSGESALMFFDTISIGSMKYTGTALPKIGGISGTVTGKQSMSTETVAKNCYFLNTLCQSPIPWVQYGKLENLNALTASSMKSSNSFAGFDFANIWILKSNGAYPKLKFQDLTGSIGNVEVSGSFIGTSSGYNSVKLSSNDTFLSTGYANDSSTSSTGTFSSLTVLKDSRSNSLEGNSNSSNTKDNNSKISDLSNEHISKISDLSNEYISKNALSQEKIPDKTKSFMNWGILIAILLIFSCLIVILIKTRPRCFCCVELI